MPKPARITWDNLLATVAKFPAHITDRQPAIDFTISIAVVKHFLGVNWLERRTSPFDPKNGYYRLNIEDGDERLAQKGGYKLVDLGELRKMGSE